MKTQPVLLITAGPSREPIDDVRFLSNGASGRMGIEVAREAVTRGWEVHLALGPVEAEIPEGVIHHPFETALDLEAVTAELWPQVDAFVATAAVCDYRPEVRIPGKIKKTPGDWNLTLVPNPDILLNRSRDREDAAGARILVGFALEAQADEKEARRKAVKKNLDLVLCNSPGNLGVATGDYIWIEPGQSSIHLPGISKEKLAARMMEFIGTQVALRRSHLASMGNDESESQQAQS
ncbi:MAG: phosphopantothenoylcysteine decarboxylase [Pirellulales bacterium]